jgi:hypothetical protein
MLYNFYRYSLKTGESIKQDKHSLPGSILEKLNHLEEEIVFEFEKKQKHRVGITSLGNELRYSKKISHIFSESTKDGNRLIKLTSNCRDYLHIIISNLSSQNDELYVFMLENDFRNSSQLVDGSSNDSGYIIKLLKKLTKCFVPKSTLSNYLYIIEMYGFSKHSILSTKGYSKLIKS